MGSLSLGEWRNLFPCKARGRWRFGLSLFLVGELMGDNCGKRGQHGAKGEKLQEEKAQCFFSVVLRYEI